MANDTKRTYKILTFSLWGIFFLTVLSIATYFYLISIGKMGFMPDFKVLENPKSSIASEIISEDHVLLGKYYRENRTIVNFRDLSPNLVNALLATEDIRFYEHSGVDFKALGRVAYGVITGKLRGGGSTLTQQLAKNLFPRDTIRHSSKITKALHMVNIKFREWVTAIKLERSYTKQEVLVMYLNTIPFGSQAFGIKAAAKTFFNTIPDSLKVEQAALLIGMLNAPTMYSPIPPRHKKDSIRIRRRARSLKRRNVVLSQMQKYGFLTKNECDSLTQIPLKLNYNVQSHDKGLSTYFREYLRITLNAKKPERERYASWQKTKFSEDSLEWENNPLYGWCSKNHKADSSIYDLYSDGLRIYTTINSKMQKYAETAVKDHLKLDLQPAFFKKKKGRRKGPFSNDLTISQIRKILSASMRRCERYRVLKNAGLSADSIKKIFNTPIPMTVFTWNGEKDTLLSPMDSIRHYKYYLNAGFMAIEPKSGHVKAYVGGIDYKYFKYDHVTGSRRQVGSTFKPFLYTLAMMPGAYNPCYKIPNVEVSFKMPEGQSPAIYTPKFSTSKSLKKYEGKMISLKFGLSNSLNQTSAWIMKQYGPQAAINIARKMGVTSPLEPVYSLCVGAAEVKLKEMVAAYGTFANKGIYIEPIFVERIEDKDGNIIYRNPQSRREAISEETAYNMLTLMKGVVRRGTSIRLRTKYQLRNEIAGKTGTTNNNSDGWFIGLTPQIVAGAWVGGEERSIHFNDTRLGQGANMALPIWALFMKKVYADKTLGISTERKFDLLLNQ